MHAHLEVTSHFPKMGKSIGLQIRSDGSERIERSDVPQAFRGFPIALVAAGLMSIAFLGFSGLI